MISTDHGVRRPAGSWMARVLLTLALAATMAAAPAATYAPEPAVDLTISIHATADDAGSIRAGQFFTYTLTVRNLGTAPASGVTVRDQLPSSRSGISIFLPHQQGSFTCRVAEQTERIAAVICTDGTVPAGGSAAIRFQAAFSANDPDDAMLWAFDETHPDQPLVITTTATVDPDDTIAESDEGNNSSTERTALRPVQLSR